MTAFVRDPASGRFAGSVGSGRDAVPRAAATVRHAGSPTAPAVPDGDSLAALRASVDADLAAARAGIEAHAAGLERYGRVRAAMHDGHPDAVEGSEWEHGQAQMLRDLSQDPVMARVLADWCAARAATRDDYMLEFVADCMGTDYAFGPGPDVAADVASMVAERHRLAGGARDVIERLLCDGFTGDLPDLVAVGRALGT